MNPVHLYKQRKTHQYYGLSIFQFGPQILVNVLKSLTALLPSYHFRAEKSHFNFILLKGKKLERQGTEKKTLKIRLKATIKQALQ